MKIDIWKLPEIVNWVCLECGGVQEGEEDLVPDSCEIGFHQKQSFILEPKEQAA